MKKKENIETLLQGGISFGEVAFLLKMPKSTVYSVWKKIRIHGSVENKHRSGRRKLVDGCAARRLVRQTRWIENGLYQM